MPAVFTDSGIRGDTGVVELSLPRRGGHTLPENYFSLKCNGATAAMGHGGDGHEMHPL